MGSWSLERSPHRRRSWRVAGCLLALVATAACRKMATVVLDLRPKPVPGSVQSTPVQAPPADQRAGDTLRPPIEALADSDSVRALLPKDADGNLDWTAAARRGIIRPRPNRPGAEPSPLLPNFRYSSLYKGSDVKSDAVFPHAGHVESLACESCHERIFRFPNEPVSMVDIDDGKYCGVCHNKVAFPTETACERCHPAMAPEPGAPPAFLGTIVLARSRAAATQAQAQRYPPARFGHWAHRIRYGCSACHPQPFALRVGTDTLSMAAIKGGQACGACHDGRNAFSLLSCDRCHY